MERKRKTWENPRLEAQQFVPSEYCKVCFSLHCLVAAGAAGYAGSSVNYNGDIVYHEAGSTNNYLVHGKYTHAPNNGHGCGWDDNQVIRIDDSGTISVMEINTPDAIEQDELPAVFVSPTTLTLDFLRNNPGTIISWNTSGTIGGTLYTYHHKGTAILNDPSKSPNHS